MLMMAEAEAFRTESVVVVTSTSGALGGLTGRSAVACTIATTTGDVRYQGGNRSIESTLIAAVDRLKKVSDVGCDVAGKH